MKRRQAPQSRSIDPARNSFNGSKMSAMHRSATTHRTQRLRNTIARVAIGLAAPGEFALLLLQTATLRRIAA
jgi:hypothetical protein